MGAFVRLCFHSGFGSVVVGQKPSFQSIRPFSKNQAQALNIYRKVIIPTKIAAKVLTCCCGTSAPIVVHKESHVLLW